MRRQRQPSAARIDPPTCAPQTARPADSSETACNVVVSPPALLRPPDPRLLARTWPRDALQRRRRSVLFAFTFSPPAAHR